MQPHVRLKIKFKYSGDPKTGRVRFLNGISLDHLVNEERNVVLGIQMFGIQAPTMYKKNSLG